MTEPVSIVGSWAGTVYLSRVPNLGEHIYLSGYPRKVVQVVHQPRTPESWPAGVMAGTVIIGGPIVPSATVEVADE